MSRSLGTRPRTLSHHTAPLQIARFTGAHGLTTYRPSAAHIAPPLLSGHLALARTASHVANFDEPPLLQTTTCTAFQPSEATAIPRITLSTATTPTSSPPPAKAHATHWSDEESEAILEELSGQSAPPPKLRVVTTMPPRLRRPLKSPFIGDDDDDADDDAEDDNLAPLRLVPTCPDLLSLLDTDDEQLETPDTPDTLDHVMLYSLLNDAVDAMKLQSVWTYDEADLGLALDTRSAGRPIGHPNDLLRSPKIVPSSVASTLVATSMHALPGPKGADEYAGADRIPRGDDKQHVMRGQRRFSVKPHRCRVPNRRRSA